jgi:selenocysteine-specific elongation factor
MTKAQHFIIATAGHVDHGKSALVKSLTGIDPDRLPEEKARGITIDLGFANLELPPSIPGTPPYLVGIVDVPGHEDFVKNMVAGVGSIDLALFVVASDDGWMPQTEEHLQILSYLGVNRAVVALTKSDLIQDERRAIAAVHDKLRDTPFAEAPIVSTSVVTGRGLDDLKMAITNVLNNSSPPRDIGKPRLPVDRVFTLRGIGTVVTGTLIGGTLHRGQVVTIQPSGATARIRNIQSHNHDVEFSVPGTRTALNLPDFAAVDDVHRGDVVTLAEIGEPSDTLDVALDISARVTHRLRDGVQVRIHHGTKSIPAKVVLFERKELAPGTQALAQLKLEVSIFVFTGDRFVLRDSAGQNTLAGGVVLDSDPQRKMLRSEERLNFLRHRAESTSVVTSFVASQITRDRAVRRSHLLLKSNFCSGDITNSVLRLASDGKLVLTEEFAVDASAWKSFCRCAANAIEAFHLDHPEQSGFPLSDLRKNLEVILPFSDLFEVLVADLCRSEFVKLGNTIRRLTHLRALPPALLAATEQLRSALAAKPFDPPSLKQLVADAISRKALRLLVETGEVIEINAEIVIAAENWKRMTELVHDYIQKKGPATVSQLRQEIGCSRRVIIPVLEHLDREGVTLRSGDTRTIRKQ